MKNSLTKVFDKIVSKTLKLNVNSTTSVAMFQPKIPKDLSALSKTNNK